MVRKYKKKSKPYNEATIALACSEIQAGAKIKSTARKFKIGYGKLQREYKASQHNEIYQPVMDRGKRVSSHVNWRYI